MVSDRYYNREISWLRFNERVLNEALDERNPLLERVKFTQIFTTNLDEFFMKRVGGFKRQQAFGIEGLDRLRPAPTDILNEIRQVLLPMLEAQEQSWATEISPALEKQGILLLDWSDLRTEDQEYLESYFDKKLFPVLTPLAVDPGHPFPFLSNLSSSLGVILRQPQQDLGPVNLRGNEDLFARIKIPSSYPAWIRLKSEPSSRNEFRFVHMSELIKRFLGRLFPGMEILDTLQFRITRNADIDRDEEDAEDLLEMMAKELRERKFANVVRLEYGACKSQNLVSFLKRELQLSDNDVYEHRANIDFSTLSPIWEIPHRDLKFRPWVPVVSNSLIDDETSIFDVIRSQDLLVHHPYESFKQSVERFVAQAAADPKVLAIKMVLYRTGADSPFIPLLIQAAESGKQVVCLVELKARFDEEQNIQVARSLEKAGVHVVYGIVGFKTHCKVTLVVRQEGDEVRSYAHVGTGNYNATTSKIYTDFGLFTTKPEFTADLVNLFHYLTGRSLNRNYNQLIVAPIQMKQKFIELIRYEAAQAAKGKPARIIAKMNGLEDREIIEELYRASQAKVQIDLIVRGFCCLRAGVRGLSENIRVISVIGRFLEHSRIFFFQHGHSKYSDGTFLIGSADWMQRNLQGRVEAIAPVEDPNLKGQLWEFLQLLLSDKRQTWDLLSDGTYRQRKPTNDSENLGIHERLTRLYRSAHLNTIVSINGGATPNRLGLPS
ncbi:MAG: polyphosphate kinase 1 [Bdellovibrionota bacterium]